MPGLELYYMQNAEEGMRNDAGNGSLVVCQIHDRTQL